MTTPIVFIHGLWFHATSWEDWIGLFREAGYAPVAPEWPGEAATVAEARANPDAAAGYGIAAVADHYAEVIRGLAGKPNGKPIGKPIVIGHSIGGLIAQNLLGRGLAAAGIAIDAAPIKGVPAVPLSALRVASVALRNPANRTRAVSLTAAEFRYGSGNALTEKESAELYARWTIPSPGRPLFEAAFANLSPNSPAKVDTGNAERGPLLLIAGGRDRTVPPAITKGTLKRYRKSTAVTELKEFPDRGHSLTIDSGWREIAESCLGWLKGHSIT
jgi:non-heme chloroperoxidase